LHNAFQEAGLPAPRMRLEMELRRDPDSTRWVSDILRSVFPQIQKHGLSHEALGDFDTLQERTTTRLWRPKNPILVSLS